MLLKVRRGTAAAWVTANPTLASGEPAYETDTGRSKIGDGATAWTALAYAPGSLLPSGVVGTGNFDPRTSTYWPTAASLLEMRADVEAVVAGSSLRRWAVLGDSTAVGFIPPSTNGHGVSDVATRLAQIIAGQGTPVSDGPAFLIDSVYPDPRWAFAGTWAWTALGNSKLIYSGASGSTATYKSWYRTGTTVEFGFFNGNAARTFTITVDGAIPLSANVTLPAGVTYDQSTGTVTPSNSATIRSLKVTGLANSAHTLVATSTSNAAGGVCPVWADTYSASALTVANCGVASTTATGATSAPKWNSTAAGYELLSTVLAYGPSVAFVMLGINDFDAPAQPGPAAFQTAMAGIIASLQAPGTQVVLVVPNPFVYNFGTLSTAFRQVYYTLADTYGCILLDLQHRWVGVTQANAAGLLGADTEVAAGVYVHPTAAGYLDVAQAVSALLSKGIPSTPAANYTATTDPTVNDDGTRGYAVGSEWVNTASQTLYRAVSVATGAAVWRRTNADVQVFTANGTWTKPAWVQRVTGVAIGGGGSGGAGGVQPSGTLNQGGSGGGGATATEFAYLASDLSATAAVVVGAGAAGTAGQSANGSNPIAGASGGTSSFTPTSGTAVRATGGNGAAAASGATAQTVGQFSGAAGATGGSAADATASSNIIGMGAGGGGGGGGMTAAGATPHLGSAGSQPFLLPAGSGGAAGAVAGSGAAGSAAADQSSGMPGAGGGGGASSTTGNGGAGGKGGIAGGGGGGGGACFNGSTSGKGGDGGRGIVVVVSQ